MFEYVVPRDDRAGYCLASERFLIAAARELQPQLLRAWPLLGAPSTSMEDVFAVLTAQGVSGTPPFAIAEIVDPRQRAVSVVVHGEAVAQVSDDASQSLSGHGLSTWMETTWYGVAGLMLGITRTQGGLETLPVVGGAVRSDWIKWLPDAAPVDGEPAGSTTPETTASAGTTASGTTPSGTAPSDTAPPLSRRRRRRTAAIRLPDGSVRRPDLPIILGRRPDPAAAGDALAETVVLDSPRKMISSSHLRIAGEGAALRLADLGAKNGSLISPPEEAAFVLISGQACVVPIGTTIDLGDGMRLTVVDSTAAD